jgi:hypothetical protein
MAQLNSPLKLLQLFHGSKINDTGKNGETNEKRTISEKEISQL